MSPETPEPVRVLYIEDAFDQALLVKAFFKALPNYRVTHAQDGDSALQLLESHGWDLLVTDLNLPGTDGFAIIRALRAKSTKIPILVTTGYTQAQYEEQALRAGADQVIIKPFSQNDFVARVDSMVDRAEAPELPHDEVVLAIAGRLGDAEMGCGGTLMLAAESGATVVGVTILPSKDKGTESELKAASVAASILGLDFRVDSTLFGNDEAQRSLIQRTIDALRPTSIYLPAPDDRDAGRRAASSIGRAATADIKHVYGYETATTGLDFTPTKFVDVGTQMFMKMEALAAYQSAGASRADLHPRMAEAYARYWGRFKDFAEIEVFQQLRMDA